MLGKIRLPQHLLPDLGRSRTWAGSDFWGRIATCLKSLRFLGILRQSREVLQLIVVHTATNRKIGDLFDIRLDLNYGPRSEANRRIGFVILAKGFDRESGSGQAILSSRSFADTIDGDVLRMSPPATPERVDDR